MSMTLRIVVLLAGVAFTVLTARAQQPPYDLLIRGGRIVDGTGNPWFARAMSGFAAIALPRSAASTDAKAAREIDARGLVVAPGFIDLHTHSDLPLLNDGNAESKVRAGRDARRHRREHVGGAARRTAGREGHAGPTSPATGARSSRRASR